MKTAIIILYAVVVAHAAPAAAPKAKPKPAPAATSGDSSAPASGAPDEVTIQGSGAKLSDSKPPLNITVDRFETIRNQLKPDDNLLLSVSPLTVSWRRTHPEYLSNDRVIQPYRLTFSSRVGIIFRIREQLEGVLGTKPDAKDMKHWSWTLTIADEDGRVFHHYEGNGDPPEELVWNGQNDQGEWVRAGRSYSAVYTFTGPDGANRTRVGNPLNFKGMIHQEDTGMHVSLDSLALFGQNKGGSDIQKGVGVDLMRSAADIIKRRWPGVPVSIRVYANTKELADQQAEAVQNFLLRELMIAQRAITSDGARAGYSDQRVELVLTNH